MGDDTLPLLTCSPLDRPMSVTQFPDVLAYSATSQVVTLRQLADTIAATKAAKKEQLPLLKLGTFGSTRSDGGSLRHDANLLGIEGVEGDYDAGVVTIREAVERLQAAQLAAVVYRTSRHQDDAPRWRVLAPLSGPVPPAERDALIERLNGSLGGIFRTNDSFDRSRAFYYGDSGQGPEVRIVDGRALDVATDIPRVSKDGSRVDVLCDFSELLGTLPTPDDDDLFDLVEPDWERIREALAHIPADDHSDWITIGQALHEEGQGSATAATVWEEWSRSSAKFDAKDQARRWRSFGKTRREKVTVATLYRMAMAQGWNTPTTARPKPSGLSFLTPSQCEAAPSRGYVIKGILAPGDVGCIFGAPGAGKSLLAPHFGYAVAQGRIAFGMRTKVGRTFYVAAEDPHGMRGRITALKLKHGDSSDFILVEGVNDLLSEKAPDLVALVEATEAQRPALIFLDTLAMSFPGLEENSADAMGRVVAVARALTQWGAAVVLIHHDTKAEGKTPRGHSLLNGALDMALHVSRDEFGVVRARLTKNRNGSCDRDVAFLIDTRTLGVDEDGEPTTAALVDELAGANVPKAEKLSPATSAAFDILLALEADNSRTDPDGPALSGVSETEWREACVASRTVSASEDVESRKKAFRRASSELARQGRTTTTGDHVRSIKPHSINMIDSLEDGLDD